MRKFKFILKDKILKLPEKPGVYAFKNKGEFLYIGKSGDIKQRVKNHFQQTSYKDGLFVDKVKRVGIIETDSEIEALILEAKLIKKHQPKFNVLWRDDKNYFYIGITKENYPRVFITHQTKKLKGEPEIKYIGPFVDGSALKTTLKTLRKVFPYRSCKKLPKRPCLWYQLRRCPAPCLLKSSKVGKEISDSLKMKKELQKNIKNLTQILKGKKRKVFKNLKKQMKKASKEKDFERAAKIRDKIHALERIISHAKVISISPSFKSNWKKAKKELRKLTNKEGRLTRIEGCDVSNIQGKKATGSMVTFIKGKPNKGFYRKFKIKVTEKPNDIAMIKETIRRRLKHREWGFPDLILVDGGKAQLNAALSEINKAKTEKIIKVISLAKKENKLFVENKKNPLLLKNLAREVSNLILQIRDESHRFALKYHKKLRKKGLIK